MKSIVTTAVLGALIAEFGLTGFNPDPESVASESQQQATAVVEQILPPGSEFEVSGRTLPRAEISSDVDEGVRRVSNGVRQLPSLGVKIAEQVEQKGIVALAYDDPEIQRAGRAVGEEIGLGMRSFAISVAKDMIMTARENR